MQTALSTVKGEEENLNHKWSTVQNGKELEDHQSIISGVYCTSLHNAFFLVSPIFREAITE